LKREPFPQGASIVIPEGSSLIQHRNRDGKKCVFCKKRLALALRIVYSVFKGIEKQKLRVG